MNGKHSLRVLDGDNRKEYFGTHCPMAKNTSKLAAVCSTRHVPVHMGLARAGELQSRMAALEKSRPPASESWAVLPIPLLAAHSTSTNPSLSLPAGQLKTETLGSVAGFRPDVHAKFD